MSEICKNLLQGRTLPPESTIVGGTDYKTGNLKTAHISSEHYITVKASKHLLEWSPKISKQFC